jgi:hypothetical protein
MGHARAVEALTGLLREGYEAPEVVEALKTLGWKPQSEIEHAAWLVGEGKYHLAADLGPAAIPGLTRFLTNEDAREALARLLPSLNAAPSMTKTCTGLQTCPTKQAYTMSPTIQNTPRCPIWRWNTPSAAPPCAIWPNRSWHGAKQNNRPNPERQSERL